MTNPYPPEAETPRTIAEQIGDDQTVIVRTDTVAPADMVDKRHAPALTSVLATIAAIDAQSWRSKAHHPDDTPIFDGYFIVGIDLATGPITYHYPLSSWDNFAGVPVWEHAPKWDGATAHDSVTRLMGFAVHLRIAIEEGRAVLDRAREAADKVVRESEQEGGQ
jgi:hypothetical protein